MAVLIEQAAIHTRAGPSLPDRAGLPNALMDALARGAHPP